MAPAFLNLHTAVMIILILGRNRLFFFHGEQVSLLLLHHDYDPTCTCFIPGLLRPAFSLKIAVWCASLECLSYIYTILYIRASKYIPPPSAKLPFYPYYMLAQAVSSGVALTKSAFPVCSSRRVRKVG